jgi:flavoprotein
MQTKLRLECLCPHCLICTHVPDFAADKRNSQVGIRCETCSTPFEIIVADGVSGSKNVVVVG